MLRFPLPLQGRDEAVLFGDTLAGRQQGEGDGLGPEAVVPTSTSCTRRGRRGSTCYATNR